MSQQPPEINEDTEGNLYKLTGEVRCPRAGEFYPYKGKVYRAIWDFSTQYPIYKKIADSELLSALIKIRDWKLPNAVADHYKDGILREVPYYVAHGSQGEQAYIRNIAEVALRMGSLEIELLRNDAKNWKVVAEARSGAVSRLEERTREASRALIDKIGTHGPEYVNDTAARAVQHIDKLEKEVARLKDENKALVMVDRINTIIDNLSKKPLSYINSTNIK